MKKNKKKSRNQKGEPRRLSLNRETIRFLNEPALLERARGGATQGCGSVWGPDCGPHSYNCPPV